MRSAKLVSIIENIVDDILLTSTPIVVVSSSAPSQKMSSSAQSRMDSDIFDTLV